VFFLQRKDETALSGGRYPEKVYYRAGQDFVSRKNRGLCAAPEGFSRIDKEGKVFSTFAVCAKSLIF